MPSSRMTPGPWTQRQKQGGKDEFAVLGPRINDRWDSHPTVAFVNGAANARAIAALPELVQVARDLLDIGDSESRIQMRRILARIDNGE